MLLVGLGIRSQGLASVELVLLLLGNWGYELRSALDLGQVVGAYDRAIVGLERFGRLTLLAHGHAALDREAVESGLGVDPAVVLLVELDLANTLLRLGSQVRDRLHNIVIGNGGGDRQLRAEMLTI